MFKEPIQSDYPIVSHWSGCDIEQPFDLAWEMYHRDLEENERSMDEMEARGGPVFAIWLTYGDEIPF